MKKFVKKAYMFINSLKFISEPKKIAENLFFSSALENISASKHIFSVKDVYRLLYKIKPFSVKCEWILNL